MLTEFIQFKVIKSHPQLPRQSASKCYDSKFSLQMGTNIENSKAQQHSKGFASSKHLNRNQNIYTQNFDIKNHKTYQHQGCFEKPKNSTKFPFYGNSNYLLDNSRSKIPLILSPKKLSLIKKQQTSLGKQVPLIQSPSYKHSIKNKQKYILSSNKNEEINKISKPKKFDVKYQSKNNQGSQYYSIKNKQDSIFRSTTYENLSPIRHKLESIRKNYNLQSSMKKSNQKKRLLERSDSFRAALEKSRQKRKIQKQNMPNKQKIQQVCQSLNNQYYSGTCKSLKKLQEYKKRYQFRQNIIRDPKNKNIKSKKSQQMDNLLIQTLIDQNKKNELYLEVNFVEKKVDSFIEQSVNNSNLFSLNQQQEKILNMDPY